MKSKIAMVALAATVLCQAIPAVAHDGAVEAITLPFRLVTGAAGVGIGAVAGSFEGVIDTEQQFAEHTFGQADENPMMIPVGLLGTVVAVPVGIIKGAPPAAAEWGQKGFEMWDHDHHDDD